MQVRLSFLQYSLCYGDSGGGGSGGGSGGGVLVALVLVCRSQR